MISDKVLKQFNTSDTHLVISGYPLKDGLGNNYGISWYTKETIEPIAAKKNAKFVVLAETNGNNDPHVYKDGRILVLRVFDQRHLTVYPYILKWLHVFNKINNVYVHSEFAANGGIKNFAFLVPFLVLIRLTGRRITFFAHNFVESFDSIANHLNFQRGSLKLTVFNYLLNVYNFALAQVVDRVVVMDESISMRVQKYLSADRIVTFPIFIKKPEKRITKSLARRKLNINKDEVVLLYFGFITSYKGADWIIGQVSRHLKKNPHSKIRLIIAGGEAYSLKDKKYYQEFFKKQLEKASKYSNIIITGFLPSNQVGKYFAASDLVIYPYRGLIGASGALTYALAYNKPFMLSHGLSPMLNAMDVQDVLAGQKILKEDLTFDLTYREFKRILTIAHDDNKLKNMSAFSKKLANVRDYEYMLERYYDGIYNEVSLKKGSIIMRLAARYA